MNGDTGDGGADYDAIQFNFLQSVNIDLATGVASLVGGSGSGTFTNFEAATIFGAGGAIVSGTNGSNNMFVRGTGNTITLLDGNDNVELDSGGNFIDGGAGTTDSVKFNTSADVIVDLSLPVGSTDIGGLIGTITGFEVIRTGSGNDNITGTSSDDRVEVDTGNDIVSTGSGADLIFVNDGGDTLDGGAGLNDTLFVTTTDDVTADISIPLGTLQIGGDALSTINGIENITSGSGNDTLIGGAGVSVLLGQDGNDMIFGGDGNDAIRGGNGMDTLFGGAGNDQIQGGADSDTADYSGANSIDYIINNLGGGDWTVTEIATSDFDTLTSIETLHFDDMDFFA